MGIIQRQSIKQSLVTYFGIAIGAFSTLFIYPYLGKEKLGIIQFILNTGVFFSPFVGIGLSAAAIQFFPKFKDSESEKGYFLFVLLRNTFISACIFIPLIFLLKKPIGHFFDNAYLFNNYLPYILVTAILMAFIALMQAYIANFGRIVIPSMLQNVGMKVLQLALVVLFLNNFITYDSILNGLTIGLFLVFTGTIIYLKTIGGLALNTEGGKNTDPKIWSEIRHYASFSVLMNLSGILAMQLDRILIGLLIGASPLAVFTIPLVITEAIDAPRKAITSIAAPIISDSMKKEDYNNVRLIYRKSALTQFVIGAFLLTAAWVCADDLYNLMANGKEFAEGKILILILGLARLVDMGTGTNSEIIGFSKYYRTTLYMLIGMAAVNIILNLWWIPIWKNEGSAYATLVAMIFFNAIKVIFIYKKIKIQPLQIGMIWTAFLALFAYFLATLIPPSVFHPFLGIVIRGFTVSLVFGLGIYLLRLVPELNSFIDNKIFKK